MTAEWVYVVAMSGTSMTTEVCLKTAVTVQKLATCHNNPGLFTCNFKFVNESLYQLKNFLTSDLY
jgi:hypothetical protein